jgi:hypothetical protein
MDKRNRRDDVRMVEVLKLIYPSILDGYYEIKDIKKDFIFV